MLPFAGWLAVLVGCRSSGPAAPAPEPLSEVRARLQTMMRLDVGRDAAGELRSFWIHVPEGADGPLPAIFVFHDGKDTNGMDVARRWTSMWDRPYVLVFPDGQRQLPTASGWAPTKDQVAVVGRVVDAVVERYGGDRRRLYAIGEGAGGDLVDELAAELPTTFRAYARVGGPLTRWSDGTRLPRMAVIGAPAGDESWQVWAAGAGCAAPPAISPLPDRGDSVSVVVRDWTGCPGADALRVVSIEGGDGWPTGGRFPAGRGEVEVLDFDATRGAVDFFHQVAGL